MIDSFELYNDFRTWVNTQQGGFFSPQSIFIKVANIASLKLWNKWTAVAEKSQEIKDNLFPFLIGQNIIVDKRNSFYGIFSPPADYGRFATAKILVAEGDKTVPDKNVNDGKCINGQFDTEQLAEDYYNSVIESEVQMIDNQRWSACLEHLTKFPTYAKPKMTQVNSSFKVAPRDVGVIVLNYYKKPKEATFIYTQAPGSLNTGAGGQIIYNQSASEPFEWPSTVKNDLLDIIKDVYIGYTRDGGFEQINQSQKAAGK